MTTSDGLSRRAVEILERLVAFDCLPGQANGTIVGWIADYLAVHGISARILPGPEGDRSNLFATIGPRDVTGIVLSGHMDVVPADEPGWSSPPFTLTERDGALYARGASDMKGFLACVLAAAPAFGAAGLRRPVHLALSYDEEIGCRGVPHLLTAIPGLCALPAGAIVGEPSRLSPVLSHKGKAAIEVEIVGCSGHSSRPDLGLNAIHALSEVLSAAVCAAEALAGGPFDRTFAPPFSTLQIGRIGGGVAVNVIPDRAVAEIEVRAIPGMDPLALLAPIRDAVKALRIRGFDARWRITSAYPALGGTREAVLVDLVADIAPGEIVEAVSYGAEAGLFQQAGIPAIICGPGDIARAHKANEFITRAELDGCCGMLSTLARRLSV